MSADTPFRRSAIVTQAEAVVNARAMGGMGRSKTYDATISLFEAARLPIQISVVEGEIGWTHRTSGEVGDASSCATTLHQLELRRAAATDYGVTVEEIGLEKLRKAGRRADFSNVVFSQIVVLGIVKGTRPSDTAARNPVCATWGVRTTINTSLLFIRPGDVIIAEFPFGREKPAERPLLETFPVRADTVAVLGYPGMDPDDVLALPWIRVRILGRAESSSAPTGNFDLAVFDMIPR